MLCTLYAGVLLWPGGCARQAFPPGGPEDRTPPEIASSEPASGSTEIGLRSPIVVTFSEPMQRDEVEKALNIFPATAGGLNLAWQGTSLRISPDSAWASDQTYILILQAQARDAHNNRLARSLQIAFSTGAVIDSGVVSGRIVKSGRPAAGATALLYRVHDANTDPEQDTADYVVTADSSGRFEFGYLGPGAYRIFGLDDRDRDWLWNVGVEPVAVPAFDASLLRSDDAVLLPPLILTPLDTAMPAILNCAMAAPAILQLDVSEDLDSSRLDLQRVSLRNAARVIPAGRLYMLDSAASRFYAQLDAAPEGGRWTVEIESRHFGTGLRRTDSCEIVVTGETQSAAPRPAFLVEPDSIHAALAWHARVHLRLLEPAGSTTSNAFACQFDSAEGRAPCSLTTPFTLAVDVPGRAEGRGPVTFLIPAGFIRWSAGGSWPPDDSVFRLAVPFPFRDSVGQFELFYDDSVLAGWPGFLVGPQVQTRAAPSLRVGMRAVSGPRGALWMEPAGQVPLRGAVRGGDYLLFVLGDHDGNLRRDPGWPSPYRPSEALWELPDTLRVRARFTTELTLPSLTKKQLP